MRIQTCFAIKIHQGYLCTSNEVYCITNSVSANKFLACFQPFDVIRSPIRLDSSYNERFDMCCCICVVVLCIWGSLRWKPDLSGPLLPETFLSSTDENISLALYRIPLLRARNTIFRINRQNVIWEISVLQMFMMNQLPCNFRFG